MGRRGEPYYMEAAPPVDVNKNTEWFMYPGVWTTYILLLFFAWLLVLSASGCSPGAALTVVNLAHFANKKVHFCLSEQHELSCHQLASAPGSVYTVSLSGTQEGQHTTPAIALPSFYPCRQTGSQIHTHMVFAITSIILKE